jgi:nucleotide-binding universal stress UspA family protein
MKTILVPTDFSKCADNALRFAAALGQKTGARILVFHSYHVPVPATDIPIDVRTEAELKKTALKSLHDLKEKYGREYPGMQFLVETAAGFADDEIVERAKKEQCDYVVMGTHGATGLREMLLGSNTSTVMEKAACPVFAIPEDAAFREGLGPVLFAADYGMHNYANALRLIELARLFGTEVTLLHIRSGKLDETTEYAELEGFRNRLREESKYEKIAIALTEHDDVYQGLNEYIGETRPGLVVVSMRNRNFVQKVFGRSLSKRMAHQGHTPLLVLHASS